MKSLFLKNQLHSAFLKRVLQVAIPVSLQTLLQSSLNMVDQIMVGQLGEEVIAGVGLGSRPVFIVLFSIMGLSSGMSIFASQYYGKKESHKIAKVLGGFYLLGGIFTIFAFYLCRYHAGLLMSPFSDDLLVISYASDYLEIISYSFFPSLIVFGYTAILRSTSKAKLVMQISLIKVLVNTILNYMLIFGVGQTIPAYGMVGAAWATVFAQTLEMVIILIVIYSKQFIGAFALKEIFQFDSQILTPLIKVSFPLILGEFSWALGETIYVMFYGALGTAPLAAMTITFPLQGLTVGLFSGLSAAAAIVVGHELGANKIKAAKVSAFNILKYTLLGSFPLGILVAIFTPSYVGLYNIGETVHQTSQHLCWIFSLLLPVKVTNMVMAGGVLRSGGDTRFPTQLGMMSTWLFSVPLGAFAVYILKLPIEGLYLFISLEEFLRWIIVYQRVKGLKWANNLVYHI